MPQYVPSSLTGDIKMRVQSERTVVNHHHPRLRVVRVRGDGAVARRVQHLAVAAAQAVAEQQLPLHGLHPLQDRLPLPL